MSWRCEMRGLAARALLELTKKDAWRRELLAAGTLFRWLELAASAEAVIARLALQAMHRMA